MVRQQVQVLALSMDMASFDNDAAIHIALAFNQQLLCAVRLHKCLRTDNLVWRKSFVFVCLINRDGRYKRLHLEHYWVTLVEE